jgi:hypothetical protein
MDAERQIILAIAFAHVFEVPLPKYEYALRKYKRGSTLREAARALVAAGSALRAGWSARPIDRCALDAQRGPVKDGDSPAAGGHA